MMEFLSQGGFALFVWGSYGMAVVLMVGEIISLRSNHRTIVARQGRYIRLREAEAREEHEG